MSQSGPRCDHRRRGPNLCLPTLEPFDRSARATAPASAARITPVSAAGLETRAVRQVASEDGYGLVINARVDVFLHPFLAGAGPGTQEELVPEAVRRANAYLEAGVDCVFPITLWEADALRRFISEVHGPVNIVRLPQAPSLAELASLGVARVSWGIPLYGEAMARFEDQLASLHE